MESIMSAAITLLPEAASVLVTFPSPLGWMALVGAGSVVRRLTFGHFSAQQAARALDPELLDSAQSGIWDRRLVQRLQAYAGGQPVDFRDVRIDLEGLSAFQRDVLHQCRQIPYGKTVTYGELAAKAGYPRAARAVGNCLAANRVPLIIPCHRVVASDGRAGGFSAPGGTEMKRRLLALEAGRSARPSTS
jgi:methylated-DNA-[protein]-cysteine S-methyltransferase